MADFAYPLSDVKCQYSPCRMSIYLPRYHKVCSVYTSLDLVNETRVSTKAFYVCFVRTFKKDQKISINWSSETEFFFVLQDDTIRSNPSPLSRAWEVLELRKEH